MQIQLNRYTSEAPKGWNKEHTREKNDKLISQLFDLHRKFHLEEKRGMLIILQGMETSGKDSVIKNIFSQLDPSICSVESFGPADPREANHDFLWRIHQRIPSKGNMKVFSRGHYDDILLPEIYHSLSKEQIDKRYDHVNFFEKYLADEGLLIFKFFLHISHQEQLERNQERLDNVTTNWKYNKNLNRPSHLWEKYMDTYSKIINRCNAVPWTIIPSERKWYRNFLIIRTLVNSLNKSIKNRDAFPNA